jgi:hypothetical protein
MLERREALLKPLPFWHTNGIRMPLSRSPRLGLIALFLILSLSGFGCKQRARPSVSQSLLESNQLTSFATPNPEPEAPRYVSKEKGDRMTPPEVVEMRQSLRNLSEAERFRATLTIPSPEGKARGELEYVQSQGLHGTLFINEQFVSELYNLNNQLYFRHGSSSWENLTGSEEAQDTANGFKEALQFSNDPNASIRENTRVTKTENDPSGCKAYTFWQINTSGNKENYRFCIKDSYPVSIVKKTSDGDLEIRYHDINAKINLVMPKIGE